MSTRNLIHRLNRINGQIEALKRNLEEHGTQDCVRNIQLLKAATNAMKKFGEAYIQEHLVECMDTGVGKRELETNLKQVVQSAFSL